MLKRILLSIPFVPSIAQWWLKTRLKRQAQVIFGNKSFIGKSASFEGNNALGANSAFHSSHLGYGSYIGAGCAFTKTHIGKYCSIGNDVTGVFGKHPAEKFVSTHPAFFSTRKQAGFTYVKEQQYEEFEPTLEPDTPYSIKIGNDVWIGNHVRIMDGVTIGDGAIIATNTLVRKDVEPYSIVGGSPGKHLKYRFEQDERDFLIGFKWWDKDPEWIAANAHRFQDISSFIGTFEK